MHLLKSHPHAATVIEAARKMPNAMGLSISFSYAPEVLDEKVFIRVKSLTSIDLVDSPACNVGMFSAKTERDTTKLMSAYIAAFGLSHYRALYRNCGDADQVFDALERSLYYSNLSIPGYDFSNARRFGPAKPLFGLQRTEASGRQARINACLSSLEKLK